MEGTMDLTTQMNAAEVAAYQFQGQDISWLVDHRAEHRGDHPFLIWEPKDGADRTWTYAEFAEETKRVAAGLHAKGVGEGDKVLIHTENCPEAVFAWYGCARLGAVAVTTNIRSVAAEVEYFINQTGCVGAVTQPQYVDTVAKAGPGLGWIVVTDDNSGVETDAGQLDHGHPSFTTLTGDPESIPKRVADPLAPAGILFTSGTTSKPKAVVHTHGNMLWAAKVNPTNIDMSPDDVYLASLPFFHVNTQSWAIWTTIGCGGTVVLQPKFSASRFWDVIAKHSVTHISLIPFVIKAAFEQGIPESHTVKVGVFGLIMPVLDQMMNMRVLAAYGMTELVTHCVHSSPYESYPDLAMGKVSPGYEYLIVNQDTGQICKEGEQGELWIRGIRGISVFLEYFGNQEATDAFFDADGWGHTGDIVQLLEDGNIRYCDRDKDALKVGGENVSAREVEDAIREVPGLADIAVVAQTHPMLDMVPVAFIIKADPNADEAALSEQIIGTCKEKLADFKVPRAVYFTDEFPTAELGKVSKKELRDLADSYVGDNS
ncbi:MAG: AMP-binding protein [Microthrixaceae bacterium]|nr:AMP-binding protein [Microthrixaceae bacterium]